MAFLDYLFDVNSWWVSGRMSNEILSFQKRHFFNKIFEFLNRKEILFLVGPRRTGKTTLLFQLIAELLNQGVPAKNILYLSLDDPQIGLMVEKKDFFLELFETYSLNVLKQDLKNEQVFVFLDEIHFFEGFELWLKKYFDQFPKIKFIVSGSSALALKDKSAALSGRKIVFKIFPFNFNEFFEFKTKTIVSKIDATNFNALIKQNNELASIKNKLLLEFQNFLEKGGYPSTLNEEHHIIKQILNQYFLDAIQKDIVKIYSIKNVKALESLALFLCENIGNKFSYRKISNALNLDLETTIKYSKYLEETFLVFFLTFFSNAPHAKIQKEKKVYWIDTGMHRMISTKTIEGNAFENTIFNHLNQKFSETYYWSNKKEVDFIIKTGKEIIPIEAKYSDNIKIDNVLDFLTKFKQKKGIIVTKNTLNKKTINEKEIILIPAWQFLIN